MKKSLIGIALTGILAAASTGWAQNITILGAGGSTCAKYLGDSASSPAFQSVYLNWAMGYFTAINVSNAAKAGAKTLNSTSGIEASLKAFCQANPEKNFSDAVLAYALLNLK
ncbi:MAG: hypothetical protein U1F66_12065 [bacterium]